MTWTPYSLVKAKKGFGCCQCEKQVPAKTCRVEEKRGGNTLRYYCLACGERLLMGRRAMHKDRWSLCTKLLLRLRSKHKDRVVQRLS